MKLEPIIPKKRVLPKIRRSQIGARLRDFGSSVVQRMSDYPAQRLGSDYVRTGTLGKGWTMRGPGLRPDVLVVEVGNAVEYAPHVEGFKRRRPRQTKVARLAKWPAIDTVANQEWRRIRPRVIKALRGK